VIEVKKRAHSLQLVWTQCRSRSFEVGAQRMLS